MPESTLFNRIDVSVAKGIPFVFYRNPGEVMLTAMFQKDDRLVYNNNLSQEGFVFAPFDYRKGVIFFGNDFCRIYNFKYTPDAKHTEETKKYFRTPKDPVRKKHIALVQKGIEAIHKGTFSKVVLSRKEEILFPEESKAVIFKRLLNRYPDAFVYIWFHPQVGLWMGATPETLITVSYGRFKTMSLAGTRVFKGDLNVQWNEKERQEQQFVTDFILEGLDKEQLHVGKPFTKKAGSLLHICTEIRGNIRSGNDLVNLVDRLHPTPAICGLPKKESMEFILSHEGYNRSFYTGFLGMINTNDTGLFVNLRCMQLDLKEEGKAILYVGGGITVGSDPVQEWEETRAKTEVIKSVLY